MGRGLLLFLGFLAGCGSKTGLEPSDCADDDGDGHGALACGGDDCNDLDPETHGGAADEEAGDWMVTDLGEGWGGFDIDVHTMSTDEGPIPAAATLKIRRGWNGSRFDVWRQPATEGGRLGDMPVPPPTPDAATPTLASIAMGPNGFVHAVFVGQMDDEPASVLYGRNGNGWTFQSVGADETARALSIAIDGDGYLDVGFCFGACDAVTHATPDGDRWALDTHHLGGGETTDLSEVVRDAAGDAYFCASVSDLLVLAVDRAGGWEQDEWGPWAAPVARCSVAVAPGDVFVLATSSAGVTLLDHDAGGWSDPWPIAAGASRGAVAVDAAGEPWVALSRDGHLWVGRLHDGELRDVGPADEVVEMAFQFTEGLPHVAAWTSSPDGPRTIWAHPPAPTDGDDRDCDAIW